MRLRVSHRALLPDLREFIETRGGIALELAERELDAALIGSYATLERMRFDLYLLVRAWEAARSDHDGTVEILG